MDQIILFSALFLLSLLLILSALQAAKKRSSKHPPGPTPLPIVGNLFQLGDMPHRSLARLAKTYGPVMSLKLGQTTTIIISSPDAARQVLQKHDHLLSSRTIPNAITALGHHQLSVAWLPANPKWKNLRTILRTHLFSTQGLHATQVLRQQKVEQLIDHLRGRVGQRVDFGRAVLYTAINNISSSFFSVDLANLGGVHTSKKEYEFTDIVRGGMEELGSPNISDFFPLLSALDPQGRRRRFTVHLKKLYKIFDQIIDQRLAQVGDKTTSDFLDALLNSQIDRPTLRVLLADTFVAGSDTSSNVVEWAMAELLHNPIVMRKLQDELSTVIGMGRQVQEPDISRLTYLQAVVKETMRIHPPTPFLLPHKAEKSVEVCGYAVPKNSRVLVNVWAIGRDESVWEDPELFVPERFLTSHDQVNFRGQDFQLIPFGSGRRICPGLSLADRMVHLMLGSLIHSFEWRLPEGMKPSDVDLKEKFGTTLPLAVPLPLIPFPLNY